MAPLETHVAHCGACGAEMKLCIDLNGLHFFCLTCGTETPPRSSAAEADEDVVWVPVTTPSPKEG
jgi:hypothetical protein